MRVYTANQLQALVNAAYQRGLEDGRTRRDDKCEPPPLNELIEHSYQGGVYEAHAAHR